MGRSRGSDPVNTILIRDLLRELCDTGKTLLLSAHTMARREARR